MHVTAAWLVASAVCIPPGIGDAWYRMDRMPRKSASPRRRVLWLLTGIIAAAVPAANSAALALPMPLQPFTVELLDLARGQWEFPDALGQWLHLAGPVHGVAITRARVDDIGLAYLCCDPEFPEDLAHAELRRAGATGGGYRIDEPYFKAAVRMGSPENGSVRLELTDITLGPATTGDRYVAALYVMFGGEASLVWLASLADPDFAAPRLLTRRVGHVFIGDEAARVTLVTLRAAGGAAVLDLTATDYRSREVVWRDTVDAGNAAGLRQRDIKVPVPRFGVYEISATDAAGRRAALRLCRIPKPRAMAAERSFMGINLFQQQIWWYAHQAPLLRAAGIRWLRPWLAWENTWRVQEPRPGTYDFRALDAALRRLEAMDMRYQTLLFNSPAWVAGQNTAGVPPESAMAAWVAYVETVVARYRGRIRHYEVWNEPDLMWPEGTRHAGDHYLAMLKATYAAAKRTDPDCVVLGLSHAGYEDWLAKVIQGGAGASMDIATVHSYARPHDFVAAIERRVEIMERHGLSRMPLWVNEFGATAYDFDAGYSAKYGCSERLQAEVLPELYAEALSLDPAMKAFWFCSYDPRDAAHESQWTNDCGVGVLYLGFLPKLAYVSLAATAHEVDGRRCLGRVDLTKDLHQVSFEKPVALVWHDRPGESTPVPATELGCLPEERIALRDLFANPVAAGRAEHLRVDLRQGPVYLEGSRQVAALARAESSLRLSPRELSVAAGATVDIQLTAAVEAKIRVTPSPGLPVAARLQEGSIRLSVPADAPRAFGAVRVAAAFGKGTFGLQAPRETVRWVLLTVGAKNLIRDGTFALGDTAEWRPERTSPYRWDPDTGHDAPGALELSGPFDRRLVHWNIEPTLGRALRLRCYVRTEGLNGCRATLNVAAFGTNGWLGTWCLACNDPREGPAADAPTIEHPGLLPAGTTDWTPIDATLPATGLPAGTQTIAFFVDLQGGDGRMWLDEMDLSQQE